mgnify:CR=1 FL=1
MDKTEIRKSENAFLVGVSHGDQTIEVVKGRANNLDIDLVIGNHEEFNTDASYFGAVIPYTDANGVIGDLSSLELTIISSL